MDGPKRLRVSSRVAVLALVLGISACAETVEVPDARPRDDAALDGGRADAALDARAADSAVVDSAAIDSAAEDAGAEDAGALDAGADDAGPDEAGVDAGECADGAERPCYSGDPATRGVGVCTDGVETCTAAAWDGTCVGEIVPSPETCNGADDDCNGIDDDGSLCTGDHASSSCVSGACRIDGCAPSFSDCDGDVADGCECPGNLCCSGACEPAHHNGLGQSFDDCAPLGVPGMPATYSRTLALEARAASTIVGTELEASCGSASWCVYRQGTTECAIWCYVGALTGRVRFSPGPTCLCPTIASATWQ